MTQAKIQAVSKFAKIDLNGNFKGKEVLHRCVKKENSCFCFFNNDFSMILKTEGQSLKEAAENVETKI